jgi:hypothetical protein
MRTWICTAVAYRAFDSCRLGLVLFLLLASVTLGQQRTVWQIGRFDQSPLEFSSKPQGKIKVDVAKDDSKTQVGELPGPRPPVRCCFYTSFAVGVVLVENLALDRTAANSGNAN